MSVDLNDFNKLGSLMASSGSGSSGESFRLSISLIDEDPNQPRTSGNPGFSEESINELAETIRERGVKSPISVREAGNGRYIINHGARRFRASIIAGLKEIPAVIDNDYTKLDQVIENIQRNNLTANEIADFIREELKRGKSKKEVAAELGKSSAWISQYCCIIDLPEELSPFWQAGILGDDVTALAELCKCYKKNSERTLAMLSGVEKLSRREVGEFKEKLEHGDSELAEAPSDSYEGTESGPAESDEDSENDSGSESCEDNKADPEDSKGAGDRKTRKNAGTNAKQSSESSDEGNSVDEDETEAPDDGEEADFNELTTIDQYEISDFKEESYGGRKSISGLFAVCTFDASDTEYEIVSVKAAKGKIVIRNSENQHFIVPADSLLLSRLELEGA